MIIVRQMLSKSLKATETNKGHVETKTGTGGTHTHTHTHTQTTNETLETSLTSVPSNSASESNIGK